jgi:hypothetical protein
MFKDDVKKALEEIGSPIIPGVEVESTQLLISILLAKKVISLEEVKQLLDILPNEEE